MDVCEVELGRRQTEMNTKDAIIPHPQRFLTPLQTKICQAVSLHAIRSHINLLIIVLRFNG